MPTKAQLQAQLEALQAQVASNPSGESDGPTKVDPETLPDHTFTIRERIENVKDGGVNTGKAIARAHRGTTGYVKFTLLDRDGMPRKGAKQIRWDLLDAVRTMSDADYAKLRDTSGTSMPVAVAQFDANTGSATRKAKASDAKATGTPQSERLAALTAAGFTIDQIAGLTPEQIESLTS